MKRNTLLILMILFGAGAVGALVFLSSGGEGGERSRSATADRTGNGDGSGADAEPGVVVHQMPPGQSRVRGGERVAGSVPPATREPYDSPEMIAARQRYAGRIEELVGLMIDGSLSPSQRMANKRELQQLLRQMGHRVTPAVRQRLLELLGTVEPRWRNQVADAIGSLQGDVETAHALVEMLRTCGYLHIYFRR